MHRYIGRDNLRKRLEPLEGLPGITSYGSGTVRIESAEENLDIRPSFGLGHEGRYDHVHVAPLLEEIARDHVVAAVLVRLGGYGVGVFDGERLVASKVGSRFVKGRHKKGGSSSSRFRRRRDEQARALTREAADVAAQVLAPHRDAIGFVAFGGDRAAIEAVLAARPELGWLREHALARFFTVPEPRQRILEQLPYDLYAVQVDSLSRRPDTVRIRPVEPHEGERLRAIAVAAKTHWGYDPVWVRDWAAEGDFSPDALARRAVFVAEAQGGAIAFAALLPEAELCVLDDLWVEPEWIGRGVGSRLFRFCAAEARRLGAERMEWEAEPNAVGFYERMGARRLRDSEPTALGRVIPVMGIELADLPPPAQDRN